VAVETRSAAHPGRIELIDLLRGISLAAMAAYHLLWDLSFYRVIDIGIGYDPVWIGIQRSILTAFLLLVGAGLWLAHGNGIRWTSFWRRWAMIVAGALLVTLGTWFLLPDYIAYFGVLHAIALFSLLALPLIRAPLPVVLVVAFFFLVPPAILSSPMFNERWLSWIGFFTATPSTTDLVPVFPWFGVVLLGIAVARIASERGAMVSAARVKVRDPIGVTLRTIGRWSLAFYLLHQPLLVGLTMLIAQAPG
jgi:uncharacterized membrane protein